MTFVGVMQGNNWPAGTKIATYGKVSNGNPGPKAACETGKTSVAKPCKTWLETLGIELL
jgi:hypothetical protein